jgi:hypothetical protein
VKQGGELHEQIDFRMFFVWGRQQRMCMRVVSLMHWVEGQTANMVLAQITEGLKTDFDFYVNCDGFSLKDVGLNR